MSSSNGHHEYDANLLLATPAPTKGMLQSGYATDLLEDKQPKPPRRDDLESGRHKTVSRHASTPNRPRDVVEPKIASNVSLPKPTPSKTPFYRTTKGIIIIVIAGVIILAAIIGGAVGGAKSKETSAVNVQQNAPGSGNSISTSTTPGSGSGGTAGQSVGGVAPTPGRTTLTQTFTSFVSASPTPLDFPPVVSST